MPLISYLMSSSAIQIRSSCFLYVCIQGVSIQSYILLFCRHWYVSDSCQSEIVSSDNDFALTFVPSDNAEGMQLCVGICPLHTLRPQCSLLQNVMVQSSSYKNHKGNFWPLQFNLIVSVFCCDNPVHLNLSQ